MAKRKIVYRLENDEVKKLTESLNTALATIEGLEWGFRLAKKQLDHLEATQQMHLNQLAELHSIIAHLKGAK